MVLKLGHHQLKVGAGSGSHRDVDLRESDRFAHGPRRSSDLLPAVHVDVPRHEIHGVLVAARGTVGIWVARIRRRCRRCRSNRLVCSAVDRSNAWWGSWIQAGHRQIGVIRSDHAGACRRRRCLIARHACETTARRLGGAAAPRSSRQGTPITCAGGCVRTSATCSCSLGCGCDAPGRCNGTHDHEHSLIELHSSPRSQPTSFQADLAERNFGGSGRGAERNARGAVGSKRGIRQERSLVGLRLGPSW
jgi:hypothetical protein